MSIFFERECGFKKCLLTNSCTDALENLITLRTKVVCQLVFQNITKFFVMDLFGLDWFRFCMIGRRENAGRINYHSTIAL